MCERCETQFAEQAAIFDALLASYCRDVDQGKVRGTPAERVHDLAVVFQFQSMTPNGQLTNAWFVALALERLMALEKSGLPT
jgi:hypothetical protein